MNDETSNLKTNHEKGSYGGTSREVQNELLFIFVYSKLSKLVQLTFD